MPKSKRTRKHQLPTVNPSPFATLAVDDLDAAYLGYCAEWHVARAEQQLHWAQGDLESGWDTHPNLDLSALERMKDLEEMLIDWVPRTTIGVRKLVEICLAIQAHAAIESPDDHFGRGPVIDYLKNIRKALMRAPDKQRLAA